MKVCGLIPAYNEEKTIQEVISQLKRIEVTPVVIDDGSLDRTNELARKAKAIVIEHEINRGKGEAIRTGFKFVSKNPQFEYAVLIDADLQYDPLDAKKLISSLIEEKADFVMGYRKPSAIPFANRLGNFIWRTLFNIFFGTDFRDTNCGFIALTREAVKKIKNIHGGYIIENSILIDGIKNNLKFRQVPVKVTYGKRRTAKFARMFFGVLIYIVGKGLKYRLGLRF